MNDDLDEQIIGSEDGFDEFSQKSNLGDMIRKSPVAKIGIVLGVVGVLVAIAMVFGEEEQKALPSMVQQGSDVSAPPATNEATPAYVEAVEQTNEENLQRALVQGESAIPVPIDTQGNRLQVPVEEEAAEDPLHKWRRLQEETVARDLRARETVESVTVLDAEQQGEALKKLAESMSSQMESILKRNDEDVKFEYRGWVPEDDGEGSAATAGAGATDGGNGGEANGFEEVEEKEILIPAGEIEYAQTLLEANSDIPGPVLATLLSGPLKGSRLIGTFSVKEDYMTLSFNKIIVDGKDVDIEAVAVDPDTSLLGMATEVDHRYFRRIVLPAAAAFVEGFASAVAESGRTDVTIQGETVTEETEEADDEEKVATGVEEAGKEIREILDDMADVETLVIIAAGTPIGVLFTQSVEKQEEDI